MVEEIHYLISQKPASRARGAGLIGEQSDDPVQWSLCLQDLWSRAVSLQDSYPAGPRPRGHFLASDSRREFSRCPGAASSDKGLAIVHLHAHQGAVKGSNRRGTKVPLVSLLASRDETPRPLRAGDSNDSCPAVYLRVVTETYILICGMKIAWIGWMWTCFGEDLVARLDERQQSV